MLIVQCYLVGWFILNNEEVRSTLRVDGDSLGGGKQADQVDGRLVSRPSGRGKFNRGQGPTPVGAEETRL